MLIIDHAWQTRKEIQCYLDNQRPELFYALTIREAAYRFKNMKTVSVITRAVAESLSFGNCRRQYQMANKTVRQH